MASLPPRKKTPDWDVLTLGEVLGCFEERSDGLYARDCGGDALNVAVAVARMGGQAAIAGRLGDGRTAQEVMELLTVVGVETALLLHDKAAATGHCIVIRNCDPDFSRAGTAATRIRPGEISAAEVARARVLHLSGISLGLSASARISATIAAEQARACGALVSFDPAFQPELWSEDEAVSPLLSMAAQADIVFPTQADALRLFGTDDPARAIDRMLAHGPQVIILQMLDGTWVATRKGRSFVPGRAARPAYPLAIRESMIGTFLSGLTAGEDLVNTCERAVQAAEMVGQVAGAASSIPGLEDLLYYPETEIRPSSARVQPMNAGP